MISDLKKLKALALREHRDCVAPSCICGADAHNAGLPLAGNIPRAGLELERTRGRRRNCIASRAHRQGAGDRRRARVAAA